MTAKAKQFVFDSDGLYLALLPDKKIHVNYFAAGDEFHWSRSLDGDTSIKSDFLALVAAIGKDASSKKSALTWPEALQICEFIRMVILPGESR